MVYSLIAGQYASICECPAFGKLCCLGRQVTSVGLESSTARCSHLAAASFGLRGPRFKEILARSPPPECENPPESLAHNRSDDLLGDFHHFTTPTLAHLLALLTHESQSFPPKGTGLIVIDSISTLFAAAFPNDGFDRKQVPDKLKRDADQWASSRKLTFMSDFVSKLGKLATTKNIAVLFTSQTATRIRADTGATLNPAISGTAWDSGISARIVIFRDWFFQSAEVPGKDLEYLPEVRFAGVLKASGVSYEGLGRRVSFTIEKVCAIYKDSPLVLTGVRTVFMR